jgi:YjjG family noncanonical pyrimidine nucleotidase
MRFSTLLFDLDHTLLDSDTSETEAFAQLLEEFGVGDPVEHFATYREINLALWAAVERGEMVPDEVHTLRFERFAATIGLDAEPQTMAQRYAAGMGAHGELYPGARDVLEQLAEVASLALITNGLSEIQRARIERLEIETYFDAIIISAEVGTAKPHTSIFDLVFEGLNNPGKHETLMIGDSLSSDIRGGTNYGIATCWYNPHGKLAGPDDQITHEITALDQLLALVDLPG